MKKVLVDVTKPISPKILLMVLNNSKAFKIFIVCAILYESFTYAQRSGFKIKLLKRVKEKEKEN